MSLMPVKPEGEALLFRLFRKLSKEDRKTLLDLAEFLVNREVSSGPLEVPEPRDIDRPDSESVVAAIKRLSESYYMVDTSVMLNETSSLMAQHVMQGRDASAVIDELEQIFLSQYQKLKAELE